MKKFRVLVLDEALNDLKEACDYYDEINPKLGDRFFREVDKAFADLRKNPFYQVRYDSFRMKIVKKFPYIIHYIVDEEARKVLVFGVRNSFQNPERYPKL